MHQLYLWDEGLLPPLLRSDPLFDLDFSVFQNDTPKHGEKYCTCDLKVKHYSWYYQSLLNREKKTSLQRAPMLGIVPCLEYVLNCGWDSQKTDLIILVS